ncbi:MAG: 30S ribosome-binding factor RbfA [Melioribacteraceae bacterium]|nr:30S ribosome-binding factor RbfA [Melioribacteraceae bacterium]MCF8355849.1 30S ribosome-binding factor RbfA [Melioribacteraceae bacterium]MCF8392576.1 30S ribosome-binding factor RbfA [Melioribacteraceae bacterium]MCF8418552.1 30S ribosome-binding factor RbfA [Melioribacteraceae bacterium]
MQHRLEKVAALIKEEISLILLHKIQDPELGLLTVTGVKVSPDLRNAKVYISLYEKEKREWALEKINDLKGLIRSELASRVNNLRFVPELFFYIDDTMDYVEKMENLFKKIHKDDNEQSE